MNNPTKAATPDDPKHYRVYSIEPIEVCNSWGLNYNLGNVIKYVARMGKKKGHPAIEDLKKARSYIDHEIERVTLYGANSHRTGKEPGNAVSEGDSTSSQDVADTSGGAAS